MIAASLAIGWWACTVTAGRMRVLDPGNIVWDEVVAFWIVLWLLMPAGFWGQLIAFVLFRFFDAVKPGPVAWADDLFHGFGWRGGFGIIFDDLVAAFCTLLVIAIWRFWCMSDARHWQRRLHGPGLDAGHGRELHRRHDRRGLHRAGRIQRLVRARLRHLLRRSQDRAAGCGCGTDRAPTAQ